MAKLTYKDFELIPQENGVRFDLYKHRIKVNKKTGESSPVLENLYYDLSWGGALKRISLIQTSRNEDISTIDGYIKECERINKEHGLTFEVL